MINKPFSKIAAVALMLLLCSGTIYARGHEPSVKSPAKAKPAKHLVKPFHTEAYFAPCTGTCPDSAPPTNIAWSGPFTLDIVLPGTNCPVRICYCTRETSPGNFDYTITEIQTDGSDCPTTINDLVHAAYQYMFDNNSMGFPCPPCGDGTVVYWREVGATCWFQNDPGAPVPAFVPCPDPCWCMTPYRVCCNDDGSKTTIQGATVLFCPGGTTCNDPNCSQIDCTQ